MIAPAGLKKEAGTCSTGAKDCGPSDDNGYMKAVSRLLPLFSAHWRAGLLLSMAVGMTVTAPHSHAAQWLSIKKNDQQQLMIDKQSLLEEKPYTKAWVKVDYQSPQKNPESVDRVYTHAKALWYFDCATRKAATIQVFQYEGEELVYSAGTTAKQADFIEPLPESELDAAQQYVCKWQAKEKQRGEQTAKRASNPVMPAVANNKDAPVPPDGVVEPAQPYPSATAKPKPAPAKAPPNADPAASKQADTEKAAMPSKPTGKDAAKDTGKAGNKTAKGDWSYSGDTGPEHWSALNPSFAACNGGSQQSPINIDNTIAAALKPIKRLQKFPLKTVAFKDHSLLLDAGSGNMMVLDQKPYQLKYIAVHMPGEHQIKQKNAPAELHMVHEDKAGHRVILAVMLEEGAAHPVIEKLLNQLPKDHAQPKALTMRITPADLMPQKPAYYRYSGSLTVPPCSEGVQWVLMKEALKLSKFQLESLRQALGAPNQRPVQDAQGRMVLE